jgi:hypothetical protein
MAASTGAIGTARAQNHLRQILVYLNMFPINQPEVLISHAMDRFDQEGNLTDAPTGERIIGLLQNLVDSARRIGRETIKKFSHRALPLNGIINVNAIGSADVHDECIHSDSFRRITTLSLAGWTPNAPICCALLPRYRAATIRSQRKPICCATAAVSSSTSTGTPEY